MIKPSFTINHLHVKVPINASVRQCVALNEFRTAVLTRLFP